MIAILRLWKLLGEGQLEEIRRSAWVRDRPQNLALALSGGIAANYDVSADGKRLAAEFVSREPDSGQVIFLENFVDELQRTIPLGGSKNARVTRC